MKPTLAAAALLSSFIAGGVAGGAAAAQGARVVAPSGAGQQALALELVDGGVMARVCAAANGCTPEGGSRFTAPQDARPLLARAKIGDIVLADGKHVVLVQADQPSGPGSWVALFAAPLAGKPAEPIVLWTGWSGVVKGEEGEGRTKFVLREPVGRGERVLVAERREDVTLCGRPLIAAAREVDPATLTLVSGVSVQSLSDADRARATKLVAARAGDGAAPVVRLLKAKDASSAVDKKVATLTDGDPATAWSEDRGGVGRGEWVRLSSASEVGIQGLEVVVRPTSDTPGGAGPKTLYVATDDKLFEVKLAEDGFRTPGSRFEVKLPEPQKTSCVAIVLDDAYAPAGSKDVRVTLAEVTAKTAFDAMDASALVGALAGGGERARAAAALLDFGRAGQSGPLAAARGYDQLDEEGKQLAMGVVDTAPCSDKVPFFAAILTRAQKPTGEKAPIGADTFAEGELRHARDRLRQCKRAAAPALAGIVASGSDAAKIVAATELALIAPVESVPVLLDAIASAAEPTRRELRAALAHAAKSERTWPGLTAELGAEKFAARPEVVRIDLLRAIGPNLGSVRGSSAALATLTVPNASFRTRLLLQAPAAELARAGDGAALAFVQSALRRDPEAHVRARAADVSSIVPKLAPDLVAAVDDADVRVREAALDAIARSPSSGRGAVPVLARRLAHDDWTFVRVSAGRALGAMPAEVGSDDALAAALADAAPEVRVAALDALGAHRATRHAEAIRRHAEDRGEHLEVRAHAILALAAMCDKRSLDAWTKLARRAAQPQSEEDRRLGSAALAALAEVHPSDLPDRIAPLLDKKAPPWIRQMGSAALSTPPQCR